MTSAADENARSADRKHTSGGVFAAVDRHLGAGIGKKDKQRGKNCPCMGKCARRYACFSENFWHSEGWTPRIEALMEAVAKLGRTTRHQVTDSRWRLETKERKVRTEVTRGIIAGAPKEADTVKVVSQETLYRQPKA